MIFLLTQMLLTIACALALGGAIGWLLQRQRSSATTAGLRRSLMQQNAQVEQARTDVSLITQDFDELKSRSRDQIEELQRENRRLPSLHQNLEKSQTLVRQLMQKHEAQLRDLATEKEALTSRVSQLVDREQAYLKVSAELEQAQRQLIDLGAASPADVPPPAGDDDALAQRSTAASIVTSTADRQPEEVQDKLDDTFDVEPDAVDPADLTDRSAGANEAASGETSDGAPGDTETPVRRESVPSVIDDTRDDDDIEAAGALAGTDATARAPASGTWASGSLTDLPRVGSASATSSDTSTTDDADEAASRALMRSIGLDFGRANENAAEDHDANDAGAGAGAGSPPRTDDAVPVIGDDIDDVDRAEAPLDPADDRHGEPVTTTTEDNETSPSSDVREMDADDGIGEVELSPHDAALDDDRLFSPVDRHDDLKRIFGIGPVTEKALNELGITSYPQLADLKQHEIQKIADALQIFPSRIERDDWMGNARRQLEEVLEEL